MSYEDIKELAELKKNSPDALPRLESLRILLDTFRKLEDGEKEKYMLLMKDYPFLLLDDCLFLELLNFKLCFQNEEKVNN
jgi:hypothetical protein